MKGLFVSLLEEKHHPAVSAVLLRRARCAPYLPRSAVDEALHPLSGIDMARGESHSAAKKGFQLA